MDILWFYGLWHYVVMATKLDRTKKKVILIEGDFFLNHVSKIIVYILWLYY